MGAVYRAHQPELDRDVALKILIHRLHDKQALDRFQREARVMANLKHPLIATVYEFGSTDGIGYLIMELVEGESLAQLLARESKLSVEQAIAITSEISEALEYAHGENVVHRDLKPANIIVQPDGSIKVIDFGLAKFIRNPDSIDAARSDLTLTGAVLGTARYIAPEQYVDGQKANHSADIFSVGVILYEMLTGDVPGGRFPRPSQKRSEVPAWLDAVVLEALEEKPEDRQASAATIKVALTDGPTSLAADRERSRRLRTVRLLALTFIPLAIVAALAIAFFKKDLPRAVSGEKFVPLGHETSLGSILVTVPDAEPFFATTEVTVREYQAFVESSEGSPGEPSMQSLATVSGDPVWSDKNQTWRNPGFPQESDHPVVGVSYEDAVAFCKWLTEKEAASLPTVMAYRLPTASEWRTAATFHEEYQSKNPQGLAAGDALRANLAGSELHADNSWPQRKSSLEGHRDSHSRTAPVGSFQTDRYQLADMLGNVAEWAGTSADTTIDLPEVLGGSWSTGSQMPLRDGYSHRFAPTTRRSNIGFRIVLARDPSRLVIPPQPTPETPDLTPYVMVDKTIEIELCETVAYAAFFLANRGLEANEESSFYRNHGFKVDAILDETEELTRYISGEKTSTVTTTEGLPVYGPGVGLVVPLTFGRSRMEDGFVVRSEMNELNDAIGKTFVTAQHTSSEVFLRHLFTQQGIPIHLREGWSSPANSRAVNILFVSQVDYAMEVFESDLQLRRKNLVGTVGWPPFTTDLVARSNGESKIFRGPPENWSTDLLFINRPFAEKHPDIVKAFAYEISQSSIRVREIKRAIIEKRPLAPYMEELHLLANSLRPGNPWTIKEVCEELKLYEYHTSDDSRAYLQGAAEESYSFGFEYLRTLRALGLDESRVSETKKFLFLPALEERNGLD